MFSIFQTGFELQELDDDGDTLDSDNSSTSEGEDGEVSEDVVKRDDAWEVAHELGFLDPDVKEMTPQMSVAAQEKYDLRLLTKGMAKVAKGSRMQADGFDLIQTVLKRNPSLQPLATVLAPYADVKPGSGKAAELNLQIPVGPSSSGKPQLFDVGPISAPIRAPNGIEWKCRFCDVVMKSWGGADAHTRKEHTKVFYGPCVWCTTFKSASASSYKEHVRHCEQKAKAKAHEEISEDTEVSD